MSLWRGYERNRTRETELGSTPKGLTVGGHVPVPANARRISCENGGQRDPFGRLLSIALALGTAAGAAEPIALTGRAMGTTWAVKFVRPADSIAPELVSRAVGERLERLEQQFSTYRPDSEISQFNAAASTGWIAVSPEFAAVAGEARRVSELTGGAFDVTVAPLVGLWGFGAKARAGGRPTTAAIEAARRLADWRKLEVRTAPPGLRKADPRIAADFSSIAKGAASDSISELLHSLGAGDHFVQVGGDVKTGGAGPGGTGGWRTGIEEPRDDRHAIACVVELAGEALSTSGDYRNFVTIDGRRYGHIIDPRLGRPASSSLASVSVVHASCAWSSALATALFVLGPDEGFRWAEREKLACVFFVREPGALSRRMTSEFERRLR